MSKTKKPIVWIEIGEGITEEEIPEIMREIEDRLKEHLGGDKK